MLNVLVWLHVPDKLRPSGALGCLAESHRQAQVVNGSIMPLVVGLKWEQPTKEREELVSQRTVRRRLFGCENLSSVLTEE